MKLDRVIAVRNDKTVYRDDDRAVKVFVSGYKKSDILGEALKQTRMREIGLPVPEVLEVSAIDGKWSIISEYVNGKPLSRLIEEECDKLDEYLDLFTEIQTIIHSTSCRDLIRLKDDMSRKISEAELESTVRYSMLSKLESMPGQSSVCHGDFNPSNVIIDEDGNAHVIDWSHTTQGSASADIAKTYVLFLLDGHDGAADAYLKKICEKTSVEEGEIKEWLPLVAAAETAERRGASLSVLRELIESAHK
ncbi:MAG: phosphotransferase [Clostridia bacterium]|nr:phosphotransferase [Clostridia bacterium]